jgi:hypothetical protein
MLSLLRWPKVITLSGFYCKRKIQLLKAKAIEAKPYHPPCNGINFALLGWDLNPLSSDDVQFKTLPFYFTVMKFRFTKVNFNKNPYQEGCICLEES